MMMKGLPSACPDGSSQSSPWRCRAGEGEGESGRVFGDGGCQVGERGWPKAEEEIGKAKERTDSVCEGVENRVPVTPGECDWVGE